MPSAIDLTDLESVRALLQAHERDTDDDAMIGTLITAASRQILNHTGREFVLTADAEAREFVSSGQILDLNPYDARTVTLVRDVTYPASPTTITTYKLRPKPSKHGVYTWLEVPGLCADREIEITGTWGFPSVPEDVKHWCGITVLMWIRGDVAAFSTTFEIEAGRLQRPEALPSAVRSALKDYRRRAV